jgi:hypothetical protein
MALAARRRSRAVLSVVAADSVSGPLRISRIEPGSVARVGFAVQLLATAAVLLTAGVLYAGLWAVGLLSHLEHLIQSLFGFSSFRFVPLPLFVGLAVAGVGLSVVGTIFAVLGAGAYNVVARRTGGVEMVTGERRGRPATPRSLV